MRRELKYLCNSNDYFWMKNLITLNTLKVFGNDTNKSISFPQRDSYYFMIRTIR